MLIGEEAINLAFNSWLEKHGFDARISGLDNDFYWKPDSDTIAYSFVHVESYDQAFQRVCFAIGLDYSIDVFWLSWLHELGHSETWHLVEEDHQIMDIETHTSEDYYYHPRELIATQWAVDFVNQHADWVQELMDCVRPAVLAFFALNNIEGE